jgi:hypothetical protein
MSRLKPAFELMLTSNPNVKQSYPGLDALLGAAKAIAAKATSTKRLNKAAKAAGKVPLHGQVGKALRRSAEKAAYASVTAAPVVTPPAPAPTPADPDGAAHS